MGYACPAISLRSYAKVNLTLDVLGLREDGFHAIESVMQTVSLHDTVSVRLTDEPGIDLTCNIGSLPTDGRNLAWKAVEALAARLGWAPQVGIHLDKRVPSQAGLGGGSSNAAATLVGLNSLLGKPLTDDDLAEVAARVGSDVPFFIYGGTAMVTGRGEGIEPIRDVGDWWMTIVKPSFGVSTPWAYRRLDEMTAREPGDRSRRMLQYMVNDRGSELPTLLRNDLELPAIERHPMIAELKKALMDGSASAALMCGSGSAVFGLFREQTAATTCAESMRGPGRRIFVARTVNRDEIRRNRTGCEGTEVDG